VLTTTIGHVPAAGAAVNVTTRSASGVQLSVMVIPNASRPATVVAAAGITVISHPLRSSVLKLPVRTGASVSIIFTTNSHGALGQSFALVTRDNVYCPHKSPAMTITLRPVDDPEIVASPITDHS